MYRCYLIRNRRIVWGEYLDCHTTDEAAAAARTLWMYHPKCNSFDDIEVWHGATLIHRGECHTNEDGKSDPIASPFDSPESTIYRTWRPTTARPIGLSVMAHV